MKGEESTVVRATVHGEAMRQLFLVLTLCACGARETYVPQVPDPGDFDLDVSELDTAATGDTGTAADREEAP